MAHSAARMKRTGKRVILAKQATRLAAERLKRCQVRLERLQQESLHAGGQDEN